MKSKYSLLNKIMIAFSLSAIIFAGCSKKDTQLSSANDITIPTTTSTSTPTTTENNSSTGTVSASRYGYGNQSPVIKTGPDQTYATAVSSITLDGSGSYDPDGSISSFLWTKDFGPASTITSPNSAKTTVTGLVAGIYRFKLQITDNNGAVVTDTIRITNGSGTTTTNQAPVVNAGTNQTITLPTSAVTLSGSATDADGTITSYLWTKTSGTGGTITTANAASTTVTGLTAGSYVFNLQATDNGGANGNKTVTITVNAAATNQAPVVNAGSNQTITLPASSVSLSGSATDADGTIASYLWTKTSGTGGTITNPNSASTTVTGLTAGTYVFNLKATDNGGATGNKTVTITVNPASITTGGNYGTLMYSSGYDQLSNIVNSSNQLGQGSISTSLYKVGPGSFKSMVNTDPASNISSGWRSEVQYDQSLSPDGADITVEYDVLYEKLFTDNGLTTQWHGNASGTSGQLSLWISGGQFMIMRSVQAGVNQYQSGTLQSVQTNRWYHMRWEIRFSTGSDGYARLYIDDQLYYSATGKTCDGTGQYLKVGTNRWNVTSESTVYYDNLKIWKK
jgi:hypothetical protein